MFQPRFPGSVSGRDINFLRIIRENGLCAVTKVTHHINQTLKVVAGCTIRDDFRGRQVFVTSPDDVGHLALCKLLFSKGINGNYLSWLLAVENKDDEKARENRNSATISFELESISEKTASEWTLKSGKN